MSTKSPFFYFFRFGTKQKKKFGAHGISPCAWTSGYIIIYSEGSLNNISTCASCLGYTIAVVVVTVGSPYHSWNWSCASITPWSDQEFKDHSSVDINVECLSGVLSDLPVETADAVSESMIINPSINSSTPMPMQNLPQQPVQPEQLQPPMHLQQPPTQQQMMPQQQQQHLQQPPLPGQLADQFAMNIQQQQQHGYPPRPSSEHPEFSRQLSAHPHPQYVCRLIL